jgi:hypothetical protein
VKHCKTKIHKLTMVVKSKAFSLDTIHLPWHSHVASHSKRRERPKTRLIVWMIRKERILKSNSLRPLVTWACARKLQVNRIPARVIHKYGYMREEIK